MSNKESNVTVVLDAGRPAEAAIKKFKRLCEAAGIAKEYKKRKEYRKPSVSKKEKLESAEKRRSKESKRKGRTRF